MHAKGMEIISTLLAIALIVDVSGEGFVVPPANVTVVQSAPKVAMVCCVDRESLRVKWKFNGLVLDTNTSKQVIQMKSNCSYLAILNVDIQDNGEYSCIIMPTLTFSGKEAKANLTVLVPPNDAEIVGYESTSIVNVAYGVNFLNLTCLVRGAKSAASLKWLKGGEELLRDFGDDEYSAYNAEPDPSMKRWNTQKTLTIYQPRKELNKIVYTCLVTQDALNITGQRMNVSKMLSIHYPPGPPQISNYQDGSITRPGDVFMPTCTSFDGNPQPSVMWFRNGLSFFIKYSSNEDKKLVVSEFQMVVNSSDNDAVFRCDVKNDALSNPLSTEIKLNVRFAPTSVKITGYEKARAGQLATLTCTSSNSNPAADITWMSRSQVIPNRTQQIDPSPLGGYISTSSITVTLTQADDNVEYVCTAMNTLLGQSASQAVKLEVYYPPGKPIINGYNESNSILYGTVQRMTCTSVGGRPAPNITWSKGLWPLDAKPQVQYFTVMTREIEFIAQPNDNKANYTCSAFNEATDTPLQTSVTIKVFFPPQNVTVIVDPLPIKEGQNVTFYCDSGSSNPAPIISWRKGADTVFGIDGVESPSDFGGTSLNSSYRMVPTKSDNGVKVYCTARNAQIGQSTTKGVTLDVHHEPYFISSQPIVLSVQDGYSVAYNFTPISNPAPTAYNLYKGAEKLTPITGKPTFTADASYITFFNVSKADAGIYRIEAENIMGRGWQSFTLDVMYAAAIENATSWLSGSDAVLSCKADANPVTSNMVTWSGRAGYNVATCSKCTQKYAEKVAVLTIKDVEIGDIGDFVCTAFNNIGMPANKVESLLVPLKPVIDNAPQFGKAAARDGMGAVKCYIVSYPLPSIKWSVGGLLIGTPSSKYSSGIKETTDKFHFEAVLTISNVNLSDYGNYSCEASTERGSDLGYIILDGTSRPDPPYNIMLLNQTSYSLIISWIPGFDGGLTQHFIVRYKSQVAGTKGYNYVDAYHSPFEIKGLDSSTLYEVTMAASNQLGTSAYQAKVVMGTTKDGASIFAGDDATLIIILSVVIVGFLFLVLNAFLILLFIRRRRKMQLLEENASQANTLELYGTADGGLTETDDAKSYSTYEKSIDYEDDYKHYEDDDEVIKTYRYGPPPGTYLLDDVIPPPQPWAKPQAPYNRYPTYDNNPQPTSYHAPSQEGYAMELRSVGRSLPLVTKEHQFHRPAFVAGRPPAPPPPPASANSHDGSASDVPTVPERFYSPDEMQADNYGRVPESNDDRLDGIMEMNLAISHGTNSMRGQLV